MIRVVVDSNIYVSALVFGGTPRAVLQLVDDGVFHIVVSEAIKREVIETLTVKFGWPTARVDGAARRLWRPAQLIDPKQKVKAARDPDDDHILACAVEAGAQFIVTGDNDLLVLHPFGVVKILNPAAFLAALSPHIRKGT